MNLNESLLYKETIDYDSFKYLVEPLFNTPTLERRTTPSFGTWLTGAQYIVTQMERVRSLLNDCSNFDQSEFLSL